MTKRPDQHNLDQNEAGATDYISKPVRIRQLEIARELGAAHTFNPRTDDVVEELQALGGADAAISTAVSPKAFEQAYQSLRRGGTLVFVGLPADNHIQLPIFETVLQGLTIKGSIVGTRRDLDEVFELHADGHTRVLRETRDLGTVNESFDDVLNNRMEQLEEFTDVRDIQAELRDAGIELIAEADAVVERSPEFLTVATLIAVSTSGTRTTGSTGMSCSDHTSGCSGGTSAMARRTSGPTRTPISARITSAIFSGRSPSPA